MTEIDVAALEAARLLAGSSGDPVLTRISHRVFRCVAGDRAVVVKLFEPDSSGAFQRELVGAAVAATAVGSLVPHLAGSGVLKTGHHYVAYDEVVGIDLHTAVGTTEVTRTSALHLIGTILARFHLVTRTGFGTVAMPSAPSAPEFMAKLIDERTSMLARHNEPNLATVLVDLVPKLAASLADRVEAVLCHGDLHLRNVIVATIDGQPDARGIVDYESVTFALPEYDLAKSIVVCSAFADQDRQALLTGYGHDINETLLADLVTYHTIDGWLWAALTEHRDRNLWRTRLKTVLSCCQRRDGEHCRDSRPDGGLRRAWQEPLGS